MQVSANCANRARAPRAKIKTNKLQSKVENMQLSCANSACNDIAESPRCRHPGLDMTGKLLLMHRCGCIKFGKARSERAPSQPMALAIHAAILKWRSAML